MSSTSKLDYRVNTVTNCQVIYIFRIAQIIAILTHPNYHLPFTQ